MNRLVSLCQIAVMAFAFFCEEAARGASVDLITKLSPTAVLSDSADGPSGLPQISADGRYVLFTSGANNLTDSEYSNLGISLYVYDRVGRTMVNASATNGGWPGRGDASFGSISADGRIVLFISTSTNLGASDRFASSPDLFQKDLSSGKVTLINASASTPNQPAFGNTRSASMTPDGKFVLFQTDSFDAAKLSSQDTLGFADVFVRDVTANKTMLVSARATTPTQVPIAAANQASTPIAISTNGNFVLYQSLASDLILPAFTVITQRVWLRDLTLQTNILISRGATNGNRESAFAASMSPDARVIAFAANARLEAVDAPLSYSNVFVRFMETDTLRAMALPTALKTNLASVTTQVSPGGARVAVTTYARVSNTNQPRLFIWDLPGDQVAEIDLAPYGPIAGGNVQPVFVNDSTLLLGSVTIEAVNTINVGSDLTIRSVPSTWLAASADGAAVAFATGEALVAGDLNNEPDVYARDSAGIELISKAHLRWKRPVPDMSMHFLQSAHSTTDKVAFTSFSDDLVANDTNQFSDIFTWSKTSGETRLETMAADGSGANGHSTDPTLSRDGHWLAFVSAASNLVANDTNHMEDVFLKSLDDGSIVRVSESVRASTIRLLGVRAPILGQSGRFVAYTSTRSDMTMTNITSTAGAAYLFDRTTGENLWIGAGLGTFVQRAIAIYEPFVYFSSNNTNIYAFNVETRERTPVGPSAADPAFNSDGSLLALQIFSSGASRIYTYNPATAQTNVVLQYQNSTIRTDPISLSDNGNISFVSLVGLSLLDHDGTNDVYTFNLSNPSKVRLATTPSAVPLGSDTNVPRSQLISRDGLRVFYLASTNSPADQTPRKHLFVADILSGAVATITAGRLREPAPMISSRPTFLAAGLTGATTARDVFDSPVDKANLFYYADIQNADNDGLPDIWERAVFGSLDETESGDPDQDGATNAQEMLAETDPLSATSLLAARAIDIGDFVEVWVSDVTPRPFALQVSEDLGAGAWSDVTVARERFENNFIYRMPKQSAAAFFRVAILE